MRWAAFTLESAGTWWFALVAIAIGLAVALSFTINVAAADLRTQSHALQGLDLDFTRTPLSMWLSARMAPDVAAGDAVGLDRRSGDLDHRADRIRELAAAASVAGLVLALGTARPDVRRRTAHSASSALARPRSNGTV
jgi:hypothetical protein